MTLGLSMPEISLLFFLGLFVALLSWLFVFRRRGWDRESRIPLEDRPDEEKRGSDHGGDRHA